MKIKILVSHHKDGYIYTDSIFKPIHVGKVSSDVNLNIVGDDEGENISELNPYYCELTATFWAWKNVQSDYKGICHYRRYFWHKNIFSISLILAAIKYRIKVFLNFSTFFLKRNSKIIYIPQLAIDKSCKNNYVSEFSTWLEADVTKNLIDIYCLKPARNIVMTNYDHFSSVGEKYLKQLKQIIDENFEDYIFFFNLTMSSKELHYANMIIMKDDIFEEYSSFIFRVLEIHYNLNNKDIQNGSYKRISGYMAELLTNTFILKKKAQNQKIKYLNCLFIN